MKRSEIAVTAIFAIVAVVTLIILSVKIHLKWWQALLLIAFVAILCYFETKIKKWLKEMAEKK